MDVSERRACEVIRQPRMTQRYKTKQPDKDKALTTEINKLAKKYKRYGYALSPTDLRYRRLASEALKNDTDLLICGELTPGSLFDLCDNVFRFCHCFQFLSGVRIPIMEQKSPTSSVFLHAGKHLGLSPNQIPHPVPFLLTGNKNYLTCRSHKSIRG